MRTIGVSSGPLAEGLRATFEALGESLGVRFEQRPLGDDQNVDGWVVLGAGREIISQVERVRKPCYVVIRDTDQTQAASTPVVTFADRPELTAVLRGRVIVADDAADARALPAWLRDAVPLALKDDAVIWATKERGTCRHDYVALAPPALGSGDALFAHFSGQRIARLLPLVLFVNAVTADPQWVPPPLQAAFMIDDPNLHWPSYGFIDYGEMVRHAVTGNYHVSMATIPLDAWFVHPKTSAIFRENSAQISLLYHGNNHVFRELARPQSAESMGGLLRQAVGRITRMETRTRLEVARVMAPPHGACSERAFSEMARLGFEAICVSRGSLEHHNKSAAWTRTIGMRPCDVVAGLPVIPRFGLSPGCRNDILVAAILRQPIVPIAHHHAVADGYDLLDETAAFVNSLGDVAWRDMKAISRSLYSHMRVDSTLHVRMFCSRITVPMPAATSTIHVQRHSLDAFKNQALCWRTTADRRWRLALNPERISVPAGATVEIAYAAAANRVATLDAGPRRLAPIARRLLTEVRDRALPSVRRFSHAGFRRVRGSV